MQGGRVRRVPSVAEVWIGQAVRSWLIRAWAQSRARVWRSVGEGGEGTGLASRMRRLPRSKV